MSDFYDRLITSARKYKRVKKNPKRPTVTYMPIARRLPFAEGAKIGQLQWNSTEHCSILQFFCPSCALSSTTTGSSSGVFNIGRQCQPTSSANSPGVVDVSPVDLGVHKGQKKLVSVNVVLVLELHFNFISEDSDKTLTLLQVIWQRVAG